MPILGQLDDLQAGTASDEITALPAIDGTRTSAAVLTDDIGFVRRKARFLNDDVDRLHHDSYSLELSQNTAKWARSSVESMLSALGDRGFAWRDVARMVGVSVPAIQKWRRGERTSGISRQRVAYLLATVDLISSHYEIQEIASWFETPMSSAAPLTPMDLYIGQRTDLVIDYASGHVADPEQVLTSFDENWRETYRSDFETFTDSDGELSIRSGA